MRCLNIGILAHVDAGKTSLTERLLFTTGAIDRMGSVDAGNTQTDSLALERQRGITIKSAVVSFVLDDVVVNLIDTPGHPDFIAEVERVLRVLDGAILVISAVEGVQPQTRVLMRALQRLRIPTLLFVNKIDRGGASVERVLESIAARLTPAIVPMGTATAQGTRAARALPFAPDDAAFTGRLLELLAEQNDALLAEYVNDEASLTPRRLHDELAAQTGRALVYPTFCGSAITGAGVDQLIAGVRSLLPATVGDEHAPLAGTVFKIERGPAGEKIAYARLFAGAIQVRDRLRFGGGREGRVTAISVFERGGPVRQPCVGAGRIAQLWGLADVRIGDSIGDAPRAGGHSFAPPTLETIIVPQHPGERGALHAALSQLAEQDPLIDLRKDELRQELFVSLYGEVQKEVIQATLANDYGIAVAFHASSTICVERPVGVGAAAEFIGKAPNPFLATVGLRVEPGALGSGITFRMEVELVTVPLFLYKSVEEFRSSMEATVRDVLRQGLLGWEVTDCVVTLTHAGYWSPSTKASDFRKLTPLVLMSALQAAGTTVCEPLHHFRLEVPADTLSATIAELARLRAVPQASAQRGAVCVLEGSIPAAEVHALQQQLRGLSRGEGVLETAFERYEPIRGAQPARPRSDNNPLNRKEYLLHVLRRV